MRIRAAGSSGAPLLYREALLHCAPQAHRRALRWRQLCWWLYRGRRVDAAPMPASASRTWLTSLRFRAASMASIGCQER